MDHQLNIIQKIYHYSILCLLMLILTAPIIVTCIYAFSVEWGVSILPNGFTVQWMYELWHNKRFLTALWRSLFICISSLLLSFLVIIPVIFCVNYYYSKLKAVMNFIIMLPFVVPAVVSSVGLLQLYSGDILPLTGTPWILIGCYFTIALPFIYRSLENNIQALNLHDLIDSSKLLGSNTFKAIFLVVLPNLKKGIFVSFFLSFSFLMGEFVFANLLVGGRYETLQVYLYNIRGNSGHYSSAVVISYFFLILLSSLAASLFNSRKREK